MILRDMIIGLGEPVHTQVIGLTIEVNEEIAYNFGVFGKAKTNRGSSIFFVE